MFYTHSKKIARYFFVHISSFIILFFVQYVFYQAADVIGQPSKWYIPQDVHR